MGPLLNCAYAKRVAKRVPFQEEISDDTISYLTPAFISAASFAWYIRLLSENRNYILLFDPAVTHTFFADFLLATLNCAFLGKICGHRTRVPKRATKQEHGRREWISGVCL